MTTENEEITVLARQPGAPYVFYKEAQEKDESKDEISKAEESEFEEEALDHPHSSED